MAVSSTTSMCGEREAVAGGVRALQAMSSRGTSSPVIGARRCSMSILPDVMETIPLSSYALRGRVFTRGVNMSKPVRGLLTMALSAMLATPLALAHHGISNWDLNKDVTLTGRLTQLDYISPHAWLHLEVKGADGKPEAWQCEMRSAHALRRSGWTVEMFRVGSNITVTGSPERYKPRQCYLSTIRFADGSSMDRYGQRQLAAAEKAKVAVARPARTADGRPNLAGDWAAEQRVMSDPRGQLGTLVPLSHAAKMKPGELPTGQQAFPGARGSAASLASDPIRAA